MNVVILIGNLTKDPELRITQNGTHVCNFSMAVENDYTDSEGKKSTSFINVIAWKKLGESAANYLSKGKSCAVMGYISTRSYEKDGRKVYVTEVVAQRIKFLTPKDSSGSVGKSSPAATPESSYQNTGFTPVDTDELPF